MGSYPKYPTAKLVDKEIGTEFVFTMIGTVLCIQKLRRCLIKVLDIC